MRKRKSYKHVVQITAMLRCCGILFAQQTFSDLKHELDRANSTRAKADAYFTISKKYADGLKIDSALYFAERIKEFSQKDNYETGFGKYHLALSIAYYYRGRNDELKKHVAEAIKILTSQKENSFLGIQSKPFYEKID